MVSQPFRTSAVTADPDTTLCCHVYKGQTQLSTFIPKWPRNRVWGEKQQNSPLQCLILLVMKYSCWSVTLSSASKTPDYNCFSTVRYLCLEHLITKYSRCQRQTSTRGSARFLLLNWLTSCKYNTSCKGFKLKPLPFKQTIIVKHLQEVWLGWSRTLSLILTLKRQKTVFM